MSKKIAILGAGESGTGAAVLAKKQGFRVWLSDSGKIKEKYRNVLSHFEIAFEEGKHTEEEILDADEVIISPGIPLTAPLVQKIKAKLIPVISEIEFAARYTKARKICITGSNGKTTTTLLIHHILKNAGFNVGLAGNVGESFAMQVATKEYDWYVLEISSFQLDSMFDFKADIAILTNITPDHMDRYDYKFENYINSKFRITQNQTNEDAFIYCLDDEVSAAEVSRRNLKAQIYTTTCQPGNTTANAYCFENKIQITTNTNFFTMTLEELALQGKHNVYNSMAASIASKLVDIRSESIRQSLSAFENVPHRLEFVARIHGIDFINDSKATNVNSAWYALETADSPLIWIAGGVDKGNDYAKLEELVSQKVKAIICLGVDNAKIIETFGSRVDAIYETQSAEQAVLTAYTIGKKGDTVLLSPACASFDLFESYEDRGDKFKQAVRNL
ncbi:MAG: UDP-N-acetylmuramoyl-L-alanine--D-glutamate ligase [Bacteroidales bacterium]|nr:UDP-N-acetylmuramoyl-L-alanine--D-glutamate ligase [Bacteroidales bacterium]